MTSDPDRCTLAPDLDIAHCCAQHDADYESDAKDRRDADAALARCVARQRPRILHVPLAAIYFLAVRAAGWLFWNRCRENRDVAIPRDAERRDQA